MKKKLVSFGVAVSLMLATFFSAVSQKAYAYTGTKDNQKYDAELVNYFSKSKPNYNYEIEVPELDENEEISNPDSLETLLKHAKNVDIEQNNEAEIEESKQDEKEFVDLTIEEKIKISCENHGISFDIVLAIARLETGWFRSDAYIYGNNPGGLSRNEVPIVFDTIDDGVEAFVSNLANNYFAIGLDDPYSIGQKYCPVNSNWAVMVEELMSYGY